jgi:hypothetical protein
MISAFADSGPGGAHSYGSFDFIIFAESTTGPRRVGNFWPPGVASPIPWEIPQPQGAADGKPLAQFSSRKLTGICLLSGECRSMGGRFANEIETAVGGAE